MNLKLILLIGSLLISSTSFAKPKEPAVLFYASGEQTLVVTIFDFIAKNKMVEPLILRNVNENKTNADLALKSGKKCGLKGVMLNAFPLLVVGNQCVVNDAQIIEFMEKKQIVVRYKAQ